MNKWQKRGGYFLNLNLIMFIPVFIASLSVISAGYAVYILVFWLAWIGVMGSVGAAVYGDDREDEIS